MLKQKKKPSLSRDKKVLRSRKPYSKSNNSWSFYFKRIIKFFKIKKNITRKKIFIKITQNNIFCTLTNIKYKTLTVASSGKYKIKISKKTLKFNTAIIIKSFLKEIKTKIVDNTLLINLIAPKTLRKKIITQIYNIITNKFVFIEISEKKTFNGCRPKKQKRKKRKGLRVLR